MILNFNFTFEPRSFLILRRIRSDLPQFSTFANSFNRQFLLEISSFTLELQNANEQNSELEIQNQRQFCHRFLHRIEDVEFVNDRSLTNFPFHPVQ